jgi:endoglucanase Acf2
MIRRRALLAALLAAGLVLTGCTSSPNPGPATTGTTTATGTTTPGSDEPSTSELTADLAAASKGSVAKIKATRLASGLVPPTNRWFSGLVFGDQPQAVFPMPLSVKLTDSSIGLGLPHISASAKTIMGGINPVVQLPLAATSMRVTSYDTLTVTAGYFDANGTEQGSVVLAQGSPFITYTAAVDQHIAIEPIFTGAGPAVATVAGQQYGLVVGGGATLANGAVTLPKGGTVTLYAVPSGSDAASLASAAENPVVGGSVGYAIDGNAIRTTLTYRTANGGPTAIAPMAGQQVVDVSPAAGSYPSIYGTMPVYMGSSVTTSTPLAQPSGQLDLSPLSDSDKARVVAQIRKDAASIDFSATDSYFGGKYLYRGANLMRLAEQLGVTDVANSLRSKLTAELKLWFDAKGCQGRTNKCFVYDPAAKSMIGLAPSFGSDELNDHHFHYGYLIYAAAQVVKDDPNLATLIGPMVDLVVADIASPQASSNFPQYRNFDPYSGHSWASGTSQFADGNNQESSSEAVNAWNAVALWEQVRNRPAAEDQARWMMSLEEKSATNYWVDSDTSSFKGFSSPVVALNWGGKRDYATWFSPDPNAMLGIQLIPMGPYATYLGGAVSGSPASAGSIDRIKSNIAAATGSNGFGMQFGEYMVQYLALADPAAARAQLDSLPSTIDNGTTRSYVMAWVLSRNPAGT